jgi:hypothetical protein
MEAQMHPLVVAIPRFIQLGVPLGQGLKKSPIGQKLDFVNHPYLYKGLS